MVRGEVRVFSAPTGATVTWPCTPRGTRFVTVLGTRAFG